MTTPEIPGDIGYGLMGLTTPTPRGPDSTLFPVLTSALRTGARFWNTATFYGPATAPLSNLELIARYLTTHPAAAQHLFLSVKAFINLPYWTPNNDPANIHATIAQAEAILAPTGKKIDLIQPARVDPAFPIEDTIRVLAEYVRAGRVRCIGLSEVGAATIRRAHAVHPIAAVEVEASLWTREIFSNGVAETCAELGIPVVAYSPLGQGFLSGRFAEFEELAEDDPRRNFERFRSWEQNKRVVEKVREVAEGSGVSMAQLCIAWLRWKAGTVKGLRLIPLPGAGSVERVTENNTLVEVPAEVLEGLEKFVVEVGVSGGRYHEGAAPFLEG